MRHCGACGYPSAADAAMTVCQMEYEGNEQLLGELMHAVGCGRGRLSRLRLTSPDGDVIIGWVVSVVVVRGTIMVRLREDGAAFGAEVN